MNERPLFRLHLPAWAWAGIAVGWLALSAAVALTVGLAYGLFLAWAGVAAGVFILNPLAGLLGLIVVSVAAADWGQAFVLFPHKAYNINQTGLANLVMLGLTALYVLRRRPKPSTLFWPFVAFLAAGLVSIPFSANPFAGLRDWSRIAPLAGVWIVSADLLRDSPSRARLWIWALIVSGIWPAIAAMVQFFTDTGYHNVPEVNRVLGTLSHPITYGVYLGLIVLLLWVAIREARSAHIRAAIVLFGVLNLVLLYLTYSRGPVLAVTGALLVLAVAAIRENWTFRGSVAVLAALFLAFNVFAGRIEDLQKSETYVGLTPVPQATTLQRGTPSWQYTPAPYRDPNVTTQTFLELLSDGHYGEARDMLDESIASRVTEENLGSAWVRITAQSGPVSNCRVTKAEQWPTHRVVNSLCTGATGSVELRVVVTSTGGIVGIGVDTLASQTPTPRVITTAPVVYGVNSLSWRLNLWRYAMDLAIDRPLTGLGLGGFPEYSPRLVGIKVTPHNDFVRVFAEMGVAGLIPYLWLWGALAWTLYRLWRRSTDRPQALMAAALVAIAACYFVNSLSADLLNYPTLGWVFWSLMAVPEAFRQQPETTA